MDTDTEIVNHIKEWLDVIKDEPKDSLVELNTVYHNLRRIVYGL